MDAALKAISDPTRRQILILVRSAELNAGAIAEHFPDISRPGISQHLRVLLEAGLIDLRKDGTQRLYSSRETELIRLRGFLDQFWGSSLQKLKRVAEEEARSRKQDRKQKGKRNGRRSSNQQGEKNE